jgi:hypothetical protein
MSCGESARYWEHFIAIDRASPWEYDAFEICEWSFRRYCYAYQREATYLSQHFILLRLDPCQQKAARWVVSEEPPRTSSLKQFYQDENPSLINTHFPPTHLLRSA